MFRRLTRYAALFLLLVAALSGCGQSAPPMRVDDAVAATEDALTTLLLGPGDDNVTSLAHGDKPLLVKGAYDSVFIAADAEGFHRMSRGAFTVSGVQEIEDRVVKTVSSNLRRRGFSASAATYPTVLTPEQQTHALTATLLPAIQESGSPQDQASGRSKTLVLIRLIIADAATGTVVSERDYYSGNDVRRPTGKEHFRSFH